MVIGECTLCEKMKNISRKVKLSNCYSNHSIRATAVKILGKSGFEASHVMDVSRNEASIRSYSKTDRISTKNNMSETLIAKQIPDFRTERAPVTITYSTVRGVACIFRGVRTVENVHGAPNARAAEGSGSIPPLGETTVRSLPDDVPGVGPSGRASVQNNGKHLNQNV